MNINDLEESVLICEDHGQTKEKFTLRKVRGLDLLKTDPVPSELDMRRYYETTSYISHEDHSRGLVEKIYQWVKNLMIRKKLRWIEKEINSRGRIIDVGTGTGAFLVEARKRGWDVRGVEVNDNARKKGQQKDLEISSTMDEISSGTADVVSLWHVFEHFLDLEKAISEIDRLLSDEGLLVIAVPNFKSFDAQLYKSYWAGYDVPRHIHHFSKQAMNQIFEHQGYSLLRTQPLIFDAFYISLLSESYRGRSGSKFFFALLNGLRSNLYALKTGEYSSVVYFFKKK